jgi:hypothetical protein
MSCGLLGLWSRKQGEKENEPNEQGETSCSRAFSAHVFLSTFKQKREEGEFNGLFSSSQHKNSCNCNDDYYGCTYRDVGCGRHSAGWWRGCFAGGR